MSYAKAMKHASNVRKCRKQKNMYMGFDTGSGRWPSIRGTPYGAALMHVRDWFTTRHTCEHGSQYARECIREQIKIIRNIASEGPNHEN